MAEVCGCGRDHCHRGIGRQLEPVQHARDVLRERIVADDHALRGAGRAGGVDQISGLAWKQRDGKGVVHRRHRCRIDAIEAGHGANDDRCPGIVQQLPQALGRLRRIERHTDSPGLQDAEQAGNECRRAFDTEPNPHLTPNAAFDQRRGNTIGQPIGLTARQRLVLISQPNGRRVGLDAAPPGSQDVRQRSANRFGDQHAPVTRKSDLPEALVGIGQHALQRLFHPAQ